MEFDVFGGCVSRDLFEMPNKQGRLKNYFARSSLVSQFSPSFSLREGDFEMSSSFQKKMVLNDFNKKFFEHLNSEDKADYIIFDFLVERFKLIKCRRGVYTYSNEFKRSKLVMGGVSIGREEHLTMLEAAIKRMSILLVDYKGVFLNKFFHSKEFIDKSGDREFFENQENIALENEYLLKIYNLMQKYIPNLILLECENSIADANHKWGLSTYHFEEKFYLNTNLAISNYLI